MKLSTDDPYRIWDGTHETFVDDPEAPPRREPVWIAGGYFVMTAAGLLGLWAAFRYVLVPVALYVSEVLR